MTEDGDREGAPSSLLPPLSCKGNRPMTMTVDRKRQQGNCFKLLAACFYEPDRDLFLQEKLCDNLLSQLTAYGCDAAAVAAGEMLAGLTGQSDEELKIEYARLFVGPFELIAPPYGSVYLEKKRRVMGDTTMAVNKMYQDAGLFMEVKEAPDHIAVELEFMYYLCQAEAEAKAQNHGEWARAGITMQSEFMRTFLGPWIPAFCENIRQGTESGFYLPLAGCLNAFSEEMVSYYEHAPVHP